MQNVGRCSLMCSVFFFFLWILSFYEPIENWDVVNLPRLEMNKGWLRMPGVTGLLCHIWLSK